MNKKEILLSEEEGAMHERGCFSKMVRAGDFLFLSGITAQWDTKTWQQRPEIKGNVKLQAEIIFDQIKSDLESVGSSMEQIVKTTTYLTDMRRLNEISEVRKKYFTGGPPPASTTVGVTSLSGIAEVEIEVVALAS